MPYLLRSQIRSISPPLINQIILDYINRLHACLGYTIQREVKKWPKLRLSFALKLVGMNVSLLNFIHSVRVSGSNL